MANLMLHCGSHNVDREVIESSPTPEPVDRWHPIPHRLLLEQTERSLEGLGLNVVSQAHGLHADGSKYFGLLEVANGSTPDDYTLVVGLRNSHDKSFSASVALGNSVFVCDNLSFSGEVTLGRRHTRHIERDLPAVVSRAIGLLANLRTKQDDRIARYKETTFSRLEAHDLIVRAVDAQVVPVTRIPAVLEEWRNPRHREFCVGGDTAWRLFNAFSEAWKGSNVVTLPKRSQSLYGLLDGACLLN